MTMTEDVTGFVAAFSLRTAPAELLPRVREAFLDSFGVMLAGSREESAQIAARWIRSERAAGPCAVIAQRDFRTSPANAALANGVAAHTLDYDHFGHQSAVMVPCVLAAGEAKGVIGRELIEAYIVGVEVSALLAKGMGKEAQELGLHPAGVCGSLGAAAAAAKIFGLTREQIQIALGIAASLTAGLSQNFGTMVKPLHLGNAARNGIMAAQLAAAGFTANPKILDQRGGFFSALRAEETSEKLGKNFRFLQPGIAFKAYPCPYSSQRAVAAIIKISERHNLTPDDVSEITCAAAPNTFRVLIHHRPTTSLEAKFSLEYLLAAGRSWRHLRAHSSSSHARPRGESPQHRCAASTRNAWRRRRYRSGANPRGRVRRNGDLRSRSSKKSADLGKTRRKIPRLRAPGRSPRTGPFPLVRDAKSDRGHRRRERSLAAFCDRRFAGERAHVRRR